MRSAVLLAVSLSATAHGWTAALHAIPVQPRSRLVRLLDIQADPPDATFIPAAATGEDVPKTDGIPDYMLRTSGTVARLTESDSSIIVQDDGVHYEPDRLVSIVTSDVIDMVQQQGGSAEKVDSLGENMLVEGLLFDDFKADDTFQITSQGSADVVSLHIVGARQSSELELGQLGDDDAKRQSIASIASLASGFSGWTARVASGGRVSAGFQISKDHSAPSEVE